MSDTDPDRMRLIKYCPHNIREGLECAECWDQRQKVGLPHTKRDDNLPLRTFGDYAQRNQASRMGERCVTKREDDVRNHAVREQVDAMPVCDTTIGALAGAELERSAKRLEAMMPELGMGFEGSGIQFTGDVYAHAAKKIYPEAVASPAHYTQDWLETIYVIRQILGKEGFENFCLGNYLKYKSRYAHKNGEEDLKKADQYLQWMVHGLPHPKAVYVEDGEFNRISLRHPR